MAGLVSRRTGKPIGARTRTDRKVRTVAGGHSPHTPHVRSRGRGLGRICTLVLGIVARMSAAGIFSGGTTVSVTVTVVGRRNFGSVAAALRVHNKDDGSDRNRGCTLIQVLDN